MTSFNKTLLATALALATPFSAAAADPTLPLFDPANFSDPKPNPYMPLQFGSRQVLAGSGMDAGQKQMEVSTQIVTGPGPTLMGVPTTQVLDEAMKNGKLVERTFDYYATDNDGNLWYFGEDVTNYRYDAAGKFTGSDSKSAWRAGLRGAVPGISIAADPIVGMALFQEHAEADGAMDYFEVIDINATVTGPAGTFAGALKVFEGSTVEADLREFKYYARGAGFIRSEEELSAALDNPQFVMERQP